ncbi:MAG: enoyl-CoA hydratase/isomerase family protein, partial [Crocinitomicaceae bacterium]|nr:enoyl-CoA hydratase/isomerase family protein [Crocinitomicaceae bacterium]
MSFKNILVDSEESICTITINRPKQLNALNSATITELSEAFQSAEKDAAIKAVVLTGSGE